MDLSLVHRAFETVSTHRDIDVPILWRIQMSKKINTVAAFAAIDAFAASIDTSRSVLCRQLIEAGVVTREDAMPVVTAWAAQRTGCPLVDGKGKAKGTMVLDSTHATYEAAKKARYRVMEAFCPAEKPADKGESAPTVEKATKAEKEAHKALQAAREALRVAEAAFVASCGSKARAKAIDAALSA